MILKTLSSGLPSVVSSTVRLASSGAAAATASATSFSSASTFSSGQLSNSFWAATERATVSSTSGSGSSLTICSARRPRAA